MTISELILAYLRSYHWGKGNALPRAELLLYLWQVYDPELTDRQMRRAYEDLPICSCADGLFIPASAAEVDKYERYLSQKVPPWKLREKIERLRKAYPQFWNIQMELPI
jgi:hypothetical protein